jgi:hypothetical protein
MRTILEFSPENKEIADWLAERGGFEPTRPFVSRTLGRETSTVASLLANSDGINESHWLTGRIRASEAVAALASTFPRRLPPTGGRASPAGGVPCERCRSVRRERI